MANMAVDSPGRDQADWSDDELSDAVDAYREMQELHHSGQSFTKKSYYQALSKKHGRTEKSFEFRMQNISAVLNDMGEEWLPGLKPAANAGTGVGARLRALLAPSEPAYRAKLPAMRRWLIEVAKRNQMATYGALMAGFNIDRFSLRAALGRLGHEARDRGEPVITALVISKATGRCSGGLAKEFGVVDDASERKKLYEYWSDRESAPIVELDDQDESIEGRAARFARVKIRPQQTAFRRTVYIAYEGRCLLTGCSLSKALDAAHWKGRSWQKGHNRSRDGFLLRKDLHALYDAGILQIMSCGAVRLSEEALKNYPDIPTSILLRVPHRAEKRAD